MRCWLRCVRTVRPEYAMLSSMAATLAHSDVTHRQQPLHRRREVPSLHSQITECPLVLFLEILWGANVYGNSGLMAAEC
eukprot:COSAG01_NODE_564_length_15447_cov_14.174811_21_plen_79_part_00